MVQTSFSRLGWVVLVVAVSCLVFPNGSAFGAPFETLVDDPFDDGALGTNVNGVGTGWDWLRQGNVATLTEAASPGVARFYTGIPVTSQNSYGWALMNSRDSFALWERTAAQPVVVEWTVSSIDITAKQTANSDPHFVDLIMEYGIISGAYDSTDQARSQPAAGEGSTEFKGPQMHMAARATAENGFTEIGTSSATHQLRLRDNSNALIVLAEFNLADTLPMGTGYTVRVELSGDGYVWSFD